MGREKAPINEASYIAYVARLKKEGKGFPMNNRGDVNYSRVAEECGFHRQVLYNTLNDQFLEDLKDIGVEGPEETPDIEDRLANKADVKSKEASVLRKELDAKVQENSLLRRQIESLEAEVRKLKRERSENDEAFEEMLSTGRRCFFR